MPDMNMAMNDSVATIETDAPPTGQPTPDSGRISWAAAVGTSLLAWLIAMIVNVILIASVVVAGLSMLSTDPVVRELREADFNWKASIEQLTAFQAEHGAAGSADVQRILDDNMRGPAPDLSEKQLNAFARSMIVWVLAALASALLSTLVIWPMLLKRCCRWVSSYQLGFGGSLLTLLVGWCAMLVAAVGDTLLVFTFGLLSFIALHAACAAMIRWRARPS